MTGIMGAVYIAFCTPYDSGPLFPNDARTLRPKASLESNQILN